MLPFVAIAVLAVLLLRPTLKRLRPALRRDLGSKAVAVGLVAAALAVLVHGNVYAALCLFGAALWALGRSTGGAAPAPAAFLVQRSATVELATERGSGRRFARVIAGPHRGVTLDALGLDGCLAILASTRDADPAGAAMLEAYLDGRSPGWRTAGDADRHAGPRQARATGGMSEQEAYELLGLRRGAAREAVVRAHRTLMKTWHPDGGGTAELAARANEAKEVLLRRHG